MSNGSSTTAPAVSDLIGIVRGHALGMWRFRWLAVIVAWLICAAGWTLVYLMPNTYEAHARVFVDTQNAIEDFLGGIAAPTDVMNEVTLVVREMLSRPNVAEVARNTDLALRAETDSQFEDLITSLQRRIQVQGSREGTYSISFEDTDRQKALAVVETLLTTFVEKSLGADRTDTAQAQEFLQSQIRDYEERLTDAENRLAEFKRENVQFMPDQQGDYFARLQLAEADLQSTEGKLRLANERRTELQRQIDGEEPVFGIMSPSGTGDGSGSTTSAKIRELELQLEELRLQYTDKHPRIGQILDTIELLRAEEQAEAQGRRSAALNAPLQQNPLDLNPVYQNMRIQLSNVDVEIAALRAERSQQQQEVFRLRTMVDTIPQVEAELKRLNRDYEVVSAKHQQLLGQLETASIGEDVSRSIDEVTFRIIDPPFSDLTPVGPNRPLFMAVVLVFALGAGGALAFIRNQLNPTFTSNRSVMDTLGIPVLASISLLRTRQQRRTETRERHAVQAAIVLLLVSFVAATFLADSASTALRDILASI